MKPRQAPERYGIGHSRWRLCDLRAASPWPAGYSLPGISQALKWLKVGRQRSPAYGEKLAMIAVAVGRARRPATRTTVVYADAFSLYRQPTRGPADTPRGMAPAAPLALRPNTYCRYAGTLDVATRQVTRLGRSYSGGCLQQHRARRALSARLG